MHFRLNKLVYLPLGGALGVGLLVSAFVAPQPKLAASEDCYGVCHSATTLSLSRSSATYGNEALESFRVTVAGNNAGSGKPAGLVEVDAGARFLCRFSLSNGAGHCSVGNKALPPGTYTIRAFYNGNANFQSSWSNTKRLPVFRDSSASSLTLSKYTVTRGRESRGEFRVSVKPGTAVVGTATGMVDVYAGDMVLCHFNLSRGAGHCSLTNNELASGYYVIQAHYRGNSYLAPSVSNIRHLTVKRS